MYSLSGTRFTTTATSWTGPKVTIRECVLFERATHPCAFTDGDELDAMTAEQIKAHDPHPVHYPELSYRNGDRDESPHWYSATYATV
ncbi:hypothetical protein BV20DRAFT_242593 [Pilatotrama ljubarskyi]|nr:hypothetical protein BV20DRAFT_242593 [Pilatotrama ljubarskyi]